MPPSSASSTRSRSRTRALMQLARVIGEVVATMKDANLTATKLLVLQPLAASGEPAGRTLVALDSVGAGVGENVFFVRGREAAFPFYPAEPPTDAAIVGIVDYWHTSRAVERLGRMQIAPRRRHRRLHAEEPEARRGQAAARAAADDSMMQPRGVAAHRDRLGGRRRRREGAGGDRGQGRRRRARQEGRRGRCRDHRDRRHSVDADADE